MSVAIALYFSHSVSRLWSDAYTPEDLPSRITERFGIEFKIPEGQRHYVARYLWLDLQLDKNSRESIAGYGVSQFNFYLKADLQNSIEVERDIMAFIIWSYIFLRAYEDGGLILFEDRVCLARYRRDGKSLYDEISEATVEFPQHFKEIDGAWRGSHGSTGG